MANPGEKIKVVTKTSGYTGTLMPNEETDSLVLKLENGYNIGISHSEIISIETLEKKKEKKAHEGKVTRQKGKKTVAVLHTGGTIASSVDYETGGVSARFSAQDLLAMVPEMKDIVNIETELIANMMSEDMHFSDHQALARAVERQCGKGIDGIIIGHGTDTLCYSASSLSFMLEDIQIPVILVGSQRSSDRGSSDAAMNLICAARFIAKSDFSGVAICMHETTDDLRCVILPGTKTRKMHTSRRDAFKPINASPIAHVDFPSGEVTQYAFPKKGAGLKLKEKMSDEVGLLKTHPGMKTDLFRFYAENYSAIVIEGTGLGHAPTNKGERNLQNYRILKDFIGKGGIVAITSQCLYGRVHPSVYANLRRLSSIGCVFCEDMLPETAFIKLSWLLGNHPRDEAEALLKQDLRGEMDCRLTPDRFY